MTKELLEKSVELDQKINNLNYALNCFEFQPYKFTTDGNGNEDGWEAVGEPISTNPKIIIEFKNLCEDIIETVKLPFTINKELVDILKSHIKAELEKTQKEFNEL